MFILVSCSKKNEQFTLDLNSNWEFKSSAENTFLPATVPGTVHLDLIDNNKKSPWFVSDNITIADLAVWRLLGWLSSGKLDGVPTNILDPYKKLKSMRKAVYQHPKVNKWMLTKYNKII